MSYLEKIISDLELSQQLDGSLTYNSEIGQQLSQYEKSVLKYAETGELNDYVEEIDSMFLRICSISNGLSQQIPQFYNIYYLGQIRILYELQNILRRKNKKIKESIQLFKEERHLKEFLFVIYQNNGISQK